ncbi:branched-chain amino acid ABC transporter permease [Desulfobacula sp.]|uniref:branched-chain amino acid ABC transporter permease n=1 Tax=Desulfobacula sp. TaxID=2593537 RepID=UPI00260C75C3|nr:branched-chain amino acid ABC transporter permease [Desulfobacula sp.]
MIAWIDTLIQGVLLGGFFALSGLGLSLSFGIMHIVNIAHGDFLVVAAYLCLVICGLFGLNPLLAIIIVIPLMFLFGYALQKTILNKGVDGGELSPLLITFGLSIILHNLLQEFFSADAKSLDVGAFEVASLNIGPLHIGWLPITILVTTLVVYYILHQIMESTKFGMIVRATVDDPEITSLMGVDTKKINCLGMGLSMTIVGIAGTLFGIKSSFFPLAGGLQLLFAFEAVIIGGMGSIWGTLLGGMSLGIAQTIGYRIGSGWGEFAGHLVFFLFLLLKPSGLLSKETQHA